MENKKNIYQKLFEVKKAWIKLQRDTKAFNYKYATLSQIQEKFSEVLQEQWLLVLHRVSAEAVITKIIDIEDDKQFVESWIMLSEWTKAQDKWSEITYYRRYNLLSLLDLEVEDDDWAKAQGRKAETKQEAEQDNKTWFNEKNLEAFELIKDRYNKDTAVRAAREKYKVSKEWAAKIEDLY